MMMVFFRVLTPLQLANVAVQTAPTNKLDTLALAKCGRTPPAIAFMPLCSSALAMGGAGLSRLAVSCCTVLLLALAARLYYVWAGRRPANGCLRHQGAGADRSKAN